MENKRENLMVFILLGVLIVASLYFNPERSTGQSVRDRSVGLCNPGWTCLDAKTMAYKDSSCTNTKVTSCGYNEVCMNNYCRPK